MISGEGLLQEVKRVLRRQPGYCSSMAATLWRWHRCFLCPAGVNRGMVLAGVFRKGATLDSSVGLDRGAILILGVGSPQNMYVVPFFKIELGFSVRGLGDTRCFYLYTCQRYTSFGTGGTNASTAITARRSSVSRRQPPARNTGRVSASLSACVGEIMLAFCFSRA